LSSPRRSEPSAAPAVRCRNLVRRYPGVVAVAGLDLEVATGECFGLLGPNGAGKTTTIEILEGLLAADDGDVTVLGLTWPHDAAELRQRIGVQLQEARFSEKLTVEETVRLFRSFYRTGPGVEAVLDIVQLAEKRRARVGHLSGGQRQRLSLACALTGDPDLLFLDEPTTGLDPQSRRSLWDLIAGFRARGRTVLLSTHYMEEAERLCDRVAIMDRGRIIALGSPAQLIASLDAEHVVEFTLAAREDGTAFRGEWLRALPGVTGVREANGRIALTVKRVHETVPALLSGLRDGGVSLASLSTHSATLEDVFVALTGRQLRDA
jgi:ABC-2 type transport system ATP-binding protein